MLLFLLLTHTVICSFLHDLDWFSDLTDVDDLIRYGSFIPKA
jgi:hypothetical protein